jgi:hypothetical protein
MAFVIESGFDAIVVNVLKNLSPKPKHCKFDCDYGAPMALPWWYRRGSSVLRAFLPIL